MKKSALQASLAWATCVWFIGNTASAKPWWTNPVLKYDEATVNISGSVDPHYMNKDESDQYLAIGTSSGGGTVLLYSIPALISATSSNDVAPIIQGNTSDFYNSAWKGIAVSDDLKRVFTGQTGTLPDHTSFPLTGPWIKDGNVFSVTNDPTLVYFDGCDFSHSSKYLFSDVYKSDTVAVPKYTSLVKWDVTNLLGNGIGLVTNTVVTTSINRIRNVSSYYIGGKDLVYYGEGETTTAPNVGRVCVYDFDLGTETTLIANLPGASADNDIMNVKVGGIGFSQMHLYVQCNAGALYIYSLNADGKSVGELVKSFTPAQLKTLVGDQFVRIRNFEVVNDEQFAFFYHVPAAGNTRLHVVGTPPVTAWWRNPTVKYKELAESGGPHYLNKDESDQYLFFQSAPSTTSIGYLYSIPALLAASSANDVTPIASAVSANYYGNWKAAAISDDLLRVLTGSAGAPIMENASLPLTAPWIKDVNVFAITNNPVTIEFDGADFSHTSQYLYSDSYISGTRTRIIQWNVVNLLAGGIGLTTNNVFATSITRVRNVSNYYIGGKDLVYYGEGDAATATESKVCVYDPADGTETVLVTGLPTGASAYDIMNVKVGGVGLGQMHLYVQCDGGSLSIYDLGADGKSVGALVRSFSTAQMATLLGGSGTNTRCFEVTNDEKCAFVSYHGAGGFYILLTPQGTVLQAR